MPLTIEVNLKPEAFASDDALFAVIRSQVKGDMAGFRLLRKSLDARRSPVFYRCQVQVFLKGETDDEVLWKPEFPIVDKNRSAVICGFGPAGMFAALRLLERGIKPIVIERGKMVRDRRRDLAKLNREGEVDPDSNYCFGEGGAGTYSDGKLYTRSKKRGDVRKVLEILVAHGAGPHILYEAHPHIGTNRLPHIVEAIRETILEAGGEILFNERLTGLIADHGHLKGVLTASGKEIDTNHLILATGHSARDIFEMLYHSGIAIYNKPFAMGVRIEHPQDLIDSIQYHCPSRGDYLPPASYSLVEQARGRGVFSFCMCPGGIIAPAATAPGEIVVNGWSPSKRNGRFANSGMVVSVGETDWQPYNSEGPLAALRYQQSLEQGAYMAIQKNLVAPAQRLIDFLNKKNSTDLPECSYIPGVESVPLDQILREPVASCLREGLTQMGKKMKRYLSKDAILVGVESRTSSPVKIPRDPLSLQHPDLVGLYPCGEGAGYAGGIVSAAMDGMAVAERIGSF